MLKDQRVDKIEDKLDALTEMVEKQISENELSKEADTCLIRDRITRIYYKHVDDKTLKSYEAEDLADLYEIYKKMDGNHYIDNLYKIMLKDWSVIQ